MARKKREGLRVKMMRRELLSESLELDAIIRGNMEALGYGE